MVEALDRGCRVVGGAPYTDSNPPGQIDRVFELARDFDIDIDMHLDFGPTADGMDLEHVCRRTEEFQYGGRVAIGHVTKAASLPMPAFDGSGEAAGRCRRGADRAALDRSLSDGPPSHARSQRHARRGAGAQAAAPRRQLLALEQQHPQSVHAVRRLLADAHGQPLRQHLSGRETGRHARVLQHGHAAPGAADAARRLWGCGRQIGRPRRARLRRARKWRSPSSRPCSTPSSAAARPCRASPRSCTGRNDPARSVQRLLPPHPCRAARRARMARCAA